MLHATCAGYMLYRALVGTGIGSYATRHMCRVYVCRALVGTGIGSYATRHMHRVYAL